MTITLLLCQQVSHYYRTSQWIVQVTGQFYALRHCEVFFDTSRQCYASDIVIKLLSLPVLLCVVVFGIETCTMVTSPLHGHIALRQCSAKDIVQC